MVSFPNLGVPQGGDDPSGDDTDGTLDTRFVLGCAHTRGHDDRPIMFSHLSVCRVEDEFT